MSYRARRAIERTTDVSHLQKPREQIARPYNASENDFSEDNRFQNNGNQRSTSILPKFNNETRRNKESIFTDQTRSIQQAETRIPVPKRVSQRVPNSNREEGRITPVRERFRARHQADNIVDRKDNPRNKASVSKKVTFYRNGDKYFKGRTLFITKQRYRSFDSLLEELSRVIPLPYGVRSIFATDGSVIASINELENGACYICASGDHFIRNIDYQSTDKAKNKRSVDPCEGIQNISLSDTSSNSRSTRGKNANAKPKIITIINEERNIKGKILLNRRTIKNYEDILEDLTEMMKLRHEHVQELYNENGSKVGGLSEMFYGGKLYRAVIVANGTSTKRNLSNPSSHSSNGLDEKGGLGKQRKLRKKQRRNGAADKQGVTIRVKGKELVFYPPSKRNKQNDDEELSSAPSSQPELHWVYGYQGKDSLRNLHVLPSGEILYFVSRIVVVYSRQSNTQRHYTGHADDIKSLAVHPNQWYIATGQASGLSLDHNELSHIRIWDSETLLTLNVLQLDDYTLSVVAMAFSMKDNGDFLSCIDSSGDGFKLSIWEWKDSKCLTQSKDFVTPVSAVMFDPNDNKTIISCGKEHMYFWKWHNSKLERKNGLFENNPLPQYITCIDFAGNGDLYTGDSNGSIIAWNKASKKVKFIVRNAHEKTILCLCILESGLMLTAGGVDGRICSWDANKYLTTPLREIQLSGMAGICALEPLQSGDNSNVTLIVGTTANSIIEGSFTGPITTIVKGHKSEVPSFAVHPSRDVFVTTSLDRTAILWSAVNKKMIWCAKMEFAIQVAAFYTTGSAIAFGTTQGRWIILNAESGIHQASFQDGSEPITDLEYSPDGEHIAVGSKDGNIYIHAVYDEGMTYRRVGCCSGHTTPLMFLDWSIDGCFVQSMSTEYDIVTWEIGAFERESSQDVIRDTEWNTRNVVLGYDVVGVWRSTPTEGNLVTSSDLAWSHNLIAIGDELGYLRIFNYPCCYDESQYHQVRAHSSTVLRVMFLSSDNFLLTTAGQDCTVLQWRMEGRMTPPTKHPKKTEASKPKQTMSSSNGDQGERAHSPSIGHLFSHAKKQDKPGKTLRELFSDSDDSTASATQSSDEYSKEEQETHTQESKRNGFQLRQENDGLQGRRRAHRRRHKPRRSFEQDLYQDRDETSDERKMKILRNGRANKRYEHNDDESSDDDMYDDRLQTLNSKESYLRGRNSRRRVPEREVDVKLARNPEGSRKPHPDDGSRQTKRDGYSDARRWGFARNKR